MGNRKQFEHQKQVLESSVDAKESLEIAKYDRAKRVVEQGISLVEKRIKAGVEFGGRKAYVFFVPKDVRSVVWSSLQADGKIDLPPVCRGRHQRVQVIKELYLVHSHFLSLLNLGQQKGQDWTLL